MLGAGRDDPLGLLDLRVGDFLEPPDRVRHALGDALVHEVRRRLGRAGRRTPAQLLLDLVIHEGFEVIGETMELVVDLGADPCDPVGFPFSVAVEHPLEPRPRCRLGRFLRRLRRVRGHARRGIGDRVSDDTTLRVPRRLAPRDEYQHTERRDPTDRRERLFDSHGIPRSQPCCGSHTNPANRFIIGKRGDASKQSMFVMVFRTVGRQRDHAFAPPSTTDTQRTPSGLRGGPARTSDRGGQCRERPTLPTPAPCEAAFAPKQPGAYADNPWVSRRGAWRHAATWCIARHPGGREARVDPPGVGGLNFVPDDRAGRARSPARIVPRIRFLARPAR